MYLYSSSLVSINRTAAAARARAPAEALLFRLLCAVDYIEIVLSGLNYDF